MIDFNKQNSCVLAFYKKDLNIIVVHFPMLCVYIDLSAAQRLNIDKVIL